MTKTKIEWADEVWNPVTGCTKVSQGCKNCYAERMAFRLKEMGIANYRNGFEVTLQPHMLDMPLRWKKPRRVFVNSMSDLFHSDIPDSFVDQVFEVMHQAYWHTFLILTKRASFMCGYMARRYEPSKRVVLPNVWLGVSCENQAAADERIPLLLQTPAAVRFVSVEPMLGGIRLDDDWLYDYAWGRSKKAQTHKGFLDWIICGGESGPHARPMHPDWARGLRDQCQVAGVPFFFKQWGEWLPIASPRADYKGELVVMSSSGEMFRNAKWNDVLGTKGYMWGFERTGKTRSGRVLDGRTWDEYPQERER